MSDQEGQQEDREWLGPWCAAYVKCLTCGDRHISVHPACVEVMQCARCGEMSCVLEIPARDASAGTVDGEKVYPITGRNQNEAR